MEISNAELKNILELRHELHRHPELSGQEAGTKQRLIGFLEEHTNAVITDCGTWFYALLCSDKEGPAAAFRCEMDALPIEENDFLPYSSRNKGVSHKCGHDGHMAALCGLALRLSEAPADRPVYLFFQPAEETGAGGKECAERLKELDVQEVYAFHNLEGFPQGSVVYRRGLAQPASEGIKLLFHGKQSHASKPEEGRNPAAAIARTVLFAEEYVSSHAHKGMLLCTPVGISAGRGDFGISMGDGELSFTVRGEFEDEMKALEEAILGFAEKEANSCGLDFSYEIHDYFPETRNDSSLVDRIVRTAETLGIPSIEMTQLWRASEDFGYYTKAVPGAIFYIGSGETHAPLHTVEYDFPDDIIPVAMKMFYELAKPSAAGGL